MTVQNGGRTVQVGIISFHAAAGCERGFPAVLTRTASYLAWITANSVA